MTPSQPGFATDALRAPIPLVPEPVARPWGGRQIGAYLGRELPSGRIGELIQCSAASRVAAGPFAGQTLAALAARHAPSLLGARHSALGTQHSFPVVRFLDAPHWGPVHVHLPVPGATAGAEIWHILAAHEGSGAVLGFEQPVAAGARGLLERPVAETVHRRAVRAGETILIPPGTVHALGGGALAYGVWLPGGRTALLDVADPASEGEPLGEADVAGIDPAGAALDGRASARAPTLPGGRGLADWLGLRLERVGLLAAAEERFAGADWTVYTPIAGEVELAGEGGAARLARGESALVPAAAGTVMVRPAGALGVCTLLKLRAGA